MEIVVLRSLHTLKKQTQKRIFSLIVADTQYQYDIQKGQFFRIRTFTLNVREPELLFAGKDRTINMTRNVQYCTTIEIA